MPARAPERSLTRWSNNYSTDFVRTNYPALHESVGITDAWDLALFCERRGVSYNAMPDLAGGQRRMIYTVRRKHKAWHILNGNPYSNGLCLPTPTEGFSRDTWLGRQVHLVEMAAWWLAVVCEAEGLDIIECSEANVRDAIWNNDHSAGGIGTHRLYTYATGDGTHVDPRGFPMDVCVAWAQEYAGYSNWQNKGSYTPPVGGVDPEEDDMPSAEEIAKAVWEYPHIDVPWASEKNPEYWARNALEDIWKRSYYGWADIVPSQESGKNQNWYGRNALGESVQQGRRIEQSLATVLKAIEDSANGQPVDVDEAAIAESLIASLTPDKIAAAISDDVAAQVVDELNRRLAE